MAIEYFEQSGEIIDYKDFYIYGYPYLGSQQDFVLSKEDAIINNIKFWILSHKGDYGRNFTKGGPLDDAIGKPLNPEWQQIIENRLKDEIKKTYSDLIIQSLSVTPDRLNRVWKIQIIFKDDINKKIIPVNFNLQP